MIRIFNAPQEFWRAIFLLMGTTIGGGIFALPYVFSRSGLIPSLLGLLFLGFLMASLNLFYSQVILKTEGDHQLPGYVKRYLGKRASWIAILSMLLSLNGALLAYVILGGEFLALSLGQLANKFYHFCFYFLGVWFFGRGFKGLVKIETGLTIALLTLMLFLPFSLAKYVQADNYSLMTNQPWFFWGATLFALAGFSVIPEVEEVLRRKREKLVPAIIIGSFLPVLLYAVFAFGIWGVTGPATTADALSGLVSFSPAIARIGAAVGSLALMTSFLGLANVAKEIYYRDLGIPEREARVLALAPPFLGILLPMEGFIKVVSLTGAVGLAVSGTLICLMAAKLEPKLKWPAWLIASIFVAGALGQLI